MENKKQLAQELTNENYDFFKEQFDKEMSKPIKKRDFKKIETLTSAMCELKIGEQQEEVSEGVNKLYRRIGNCESRKNKKSIKVVRKIFPAVCCAAILLAANCITVTAWNMNIFSAVIEFTKGGFSVGFDKKDYEVIELPTSDDDPYGIIAECAKYDIYPETPHYLPEGFELTYTDGECSSYSNDTQFIFKNGTKRIVITYTLYQNEVGQIGIPSEKYNISETTVNGNSAIVSKEDNQYTITYQNGKLVTVIFTQDVNYDECDKIVASIK